MKVIKHPSVLAVLWITLIFLLCFGLGSCQREAWNEDSRNTYLYFSPENLDRLYVTTGRADFSKADAVENGGDFKLEFSGNTENYTLKLETREEFPYRHFSGFDAIDYHHEQNWEPEGEAFVLEGENLLPPNGGFYRIQLSRY